MADQSSREKLESLTVDELRARARQAGHSGLSRMKKAELVDLLLKVPPPIDQAVQAKSSDTNVSVDEGEAVGRPSASAGAVGRVLQAAGLIGGLVSLLLTLALPAAVFRSSARITAGLDSAAAGVEGSAAGLALAADNLESAAAALSSGAQALRTANQSLQSMDPLLESVGELMADELPESIEATRAALVSAQDGAGAMDRVLRGLRIFGLDYDPELPLDESLAQTAESLEGLPASLRRTERDLSSSQQTIDQMSADLSLLAADLEILAADLGESAEEAQVASEGLGTFATSLRTWGERVPLLRWPLAAAGMLFGLWLSVLHLNLWVTGKAAGKTFN